MSFIWRESAPLLLASKSKVRAQLLRSARVPVDVRPADIDERAVEAALTGDGATPSSVAGALAAAKAIAVSARIPGRLVLGADQTLALEGERFTKPENREAGRLQLERLSGETHTLASGAALAREGIVLWSGIAEARLTMRPLSPDFISAYLDATGDAVLTSVGGYHFEGLGVHLFERVDGDFSTILGLPMLPVIAALRNLGAVAA